MSQCWWRNARLYIRELVEVGSGNLIYDKGYVIKYRMNLRELAHAHYGRAIPYRIIMIDQEHAIEITYEMGEDKPKAVYPVWRYGQRSDDLEDMLANPFGQDKELCFDLDTPISERPVFGQEHRVIIAGIPISNTSAGKKLLAYLKDLQDEFPEAILHISNLTSYRQAFGYGFGAADVEPRTEAAHGRLTLPTGKMVRWESLQAHGQWITLMGMTPGQMSVPRNRCMYNIKAGEWAAKNYLDLTRFKTTPHKNVDTVSSDLDYKAPQSRSAVPYKTKFLDGDKTLCSMCSISDKCKYFRDGAVCSLPDAEPTPLANFFKTRDSEKIIDGLSILVSFNARRLERGARTEEILEEIDPEVTKLAAIVFDQGTKLAKLLNPSLRSSGVKVTVNGSDNRTIVANSTPQEMMGGIIRALEEKGIPRDKITPKMVRGVLEGMANDDVTQRAIEGQVLPRNG